MSENGHANGHLQPGCKNGGQGEFSSQLVADLSGNGHARSAIRSIGWAIDRGWLNPWNVPKEAFDSMASILLKVRDAALEGGKFREAIAASEVIRKLASDNLTLAGLLDKSERLDAGVPTDNVSQEVRVLAIEPDKRG